MCRYRFSGMENPLLMSEVCANHVLMLTFNVHKLKLLILRNFFLKKWLCKQLKIGTLRLSGIVNSFMMSQDVCEFPSILTKSGCHFTSRCLYVCFKTCRLDTPRVVVLRDTFNFLVRSLLMKKQDQKPTVVPQKPPLPYKSLHLFEAFLGFMEQRNG